MSNDNLPVPSGQDKSVTLSTAGNILTTRNTALSPMQYNARVTTSSPCAIILLLDHSGSMANSIIDNRGVSRVKSTTLAASVNKFLDEIILTCQKTDIIKDYFEVLILSYGKKDENGRSIVSVAWEGKLQGKTWVTVNELRSSPLRKEIVEVPNPKQFGAKILKEEQHIWMEPYAEGNTPMREAYELCDDYIKEWIIKYPHSFPPLVFNITDGRATDVKDFDDLVSIADQIKSNSTSDGNVLLFNMLLLKDNENAKEFPFISERDLYDKNKFVLALFDASSTIPKNLLKVLPVNRNAKEDVKALVLGNLEMIISFLNIGTSTLRNNI